jgi:hypothetical protein
MNAAARQFEISPAVRKAVGLLIGLVGPSSAGKTYSALRLATGIQRVSGGDIDFIDTENGRALYYAEKFTFNHLRFGAPFSPDDYLEAVRFCARRGAKTIIIDSMSHEHEGPGGVLEWHEALAQELAIRWKSTVEKTGMAAWGPPKTARRRLINELLQLNVNLIMTFRAKEKIKIVSGKDPKPLGWQPICGEEFMYEMVLQALLLPGSEGRPVWNSGMESERAVMKLPSQFADILDRDKPAQFDEAIGERLARWAAGGVRGDPAIDNLIADYAKCDAPDALKVLEERRGAQWKKLSGADKQRVKEAAESAARRLAPKITLDQATVLKDRLSAEGLQESLFLAHFELGSVEDLPAASYRGANEWLDQANVAP